MKTQQEIKMICSDIVDIESVNPKFKQAVYEGCIMGYTKCQQDNNTSEITRFEVIDENGRSYSKWNCEIELSYQDEGKTLKVFIKKK